MNTAAPSSAPTRHGPGRAPPDKVLRNSFFLLASTLFMAGLGFVFWVIVARLYSPAEVGLATSLLAASTLIAYVSQLGLNNTMIRFRAPGAAHSGQVTQYCVLVALAACVIACLYLVGLQWYGRKLLFIEAHPAQLLAFVFFCSCTALTLLTDAVFIAERKAEYTVVTDGLVQSLTKLALPAALVGMGAFGIVAATGAGYAAGVLASFFLMYRKLGLRPRKPGPGELAWSASSGSRSRHTPPACSTWLLSWCCPSSCCSGAARRRPASTSPRSRSPPC